MNPTQVEYFAHSLYNSNVMRELLKYLKKYRIECVIAPLFKALEAGFELLVPLVIAYIIDKGIPARDQSLIIRSGSLLLLLALVGFASSLIAQYFAAKAAVGFATDVRHDLFSKLLHFSFSKIDEVGTSTMITRLTGDVTSMQAGVNMVLRLFLRSPYIVIGATIMAFLIDKRSAMLFVILIFFLFLIVAFLVGSNIALLEKAQEKLDHVTTVIRENLLGARVIRAFCRQDDQIRSFAEQNGELFAAQKKAGVRSSLLNPVTYVIINLFIVLLIRIGAIQVGNGVITAGSVIALYNYMSQILIELIKFANLLITVNKALASGKRVSALLFAQTEETGARNAMPAVATDEIITFEHVSLSYHKNADEALTDIRFGLRKGETLGIIGGTGAGKTSLANLIAGFYPATKGQVLINGRNVDDYAKEELTSMIGFVMQKAVLFQGTIAENLKWGNEAATDEELMKAAEISCLEEVIAEHGGLTGEVLQNGKNFSGGQKQRMGIARALVKKPEILILDDSASALDYATDRKIRTNLTQLSYHPTIIIISQRTVSIQNCDHILVLEDGEMAGYGSHEELLRNCSVYAEIYRSQGMEKEGGVA